MDERKNPGPDEDEPGVTEGPRGSVPPQHEGPDEPNGPVERHHRAYTFRPGEVLISAADIPLLGGPDVMAQRSALRRPSAGERNERDTTLENLGIERWLTMTEDADVPAIVEDLRTPVSDRAKRSGDTVPEVVPRVFPDHGFYAHWHDWWPHGRHLRVGQPLASLPPRGFLPLPGSGVIVGVLDSGIRPGGVDWYDGRVSSRVPDDEDAPNAAAPGDDLRGHGTHVTGIVLQYAPGVRVIARRVRGLSERLVYDSDVAVGICDLATAGADIIVCCFGGPAHDNLPALATDAAINELRRTKPGLIVVASAGNSGVFIPYFPAALDTVIAVGAVRAETDVRTDFSNHGAWVDAAAPGENVPSTFLLDEPYKGWATWSGTSTAAPKVAAAIAKERAPGGWRQFVWFLRPRTARQAAYRLLNNPRRTWNPEVGTVIREEPYVA